uniref:Uncharacterized protein n=1 Tax=Rhizophora mucronata TaxID=61149 RepID=A0A2P2J812_RHIMU
MKKETIGFLVLNRLRMKMEMRKILNGILLQIQQVLLVIQMENMILLGQCLRYTCESHVVLHLAWHI